MVDAVRAQLVVGSRDHVDIVVNNFGNTDHASDWDAADTATWHGSYDINVVSAVRVTQAFVPDMRAAGWGRVVVMSTIGATRPGDTIPEYYTAKGALPSMVVGLAKHLAGTGITVNCVSPGIIATAEVVASYTNGRSEPAAAPTGTACRSSSRKGAWRTRLAACRRPTTSGRFVTFVVSEAAWHLNGAHLRLDGGASDAVTDRASVALLGERSSMIATARS